MKWQRFWLPKLLKACLMAYLMSPSPLWAKGEGALRALPFPDENHSTDSLTRGVMALFQADGRLIAMPEGKGFAIVSPFNGKGDAREKVFAPLAGMQRLTIIKDEGAVPDWRGIDRVSDRVMFFDGKEVAWTESDPQTFAEILRRSIPWDMIRPPRDPRGEPTTPETKALRARFKTAWNQTIGLKVAGVARFPTSWIKGGTKPTYALATRVKGYPLILIECDANEASLCQVTRHCYLEGAEGLEASAVTGIAVSEKRKMIYIGDQKNRMIHGFRFGSCYHLPRVGRLALPDRLKTMTNLFIDADDRLWITTDAPDDYLNASIYYWPTDTW